MAEYLEREALLAHLEERREFLFKENGDYDHYSNGFDEACDKVENFPAVAIAALREQSNATQRVANTDNALDDSICNGCRWWGVRPQRCSCCRRNIYMKDGYEPQEEK